MNDLRTAAQQALAFTMRDFASLRDFEAAKAVLHDNLRTALAQQAEPAQEPVAWEDWWRNHGQYNFRATAGMTFERAKELMKLAFEVGREAAPPQQAEPVEPVGWNWMLDGQPYGQAYYGNPPDTDIAERAATAGRTVRLLYTAPPRRTMVPLTEEEIMHIGMTHQSLRQVVRAVERAHGIGEQS